ncbi:MAG: hypothetical protein ACE5NG_10875 [bacterium]
MLAPVCRIFLATEARQGSEAFEGVVRQRNEIGGLNEDNCRVAPQGQPFEMLEPYEGKLSRTVLKGNRGASPVTYPVDLR